MSGIIYRRVNRLKAYITFKIGVWGVAPSGVRAAAPHSAPARTPGVYAQRLCKDAKPTKHTQPFATGKGLGVRVREFALFFIKTDFFYKLMRLTASGLLS